MQETMGMIYKLERHEKKILAALFISAVIIRSIVFIQNGNQAADGMYRMLLAIDWLKDPHFITAGLWPPLHIYMMAFMIRLWNDPFVSTRLLSLIFGTIIIFPYYYLVKLLFDRRIALVSTVILVFLSIHIQYSTYSMSETIFAFFLITSLFFFFRFKKLTENRLYNLILSAILLDIASMLRYEAWLFIPLLAILILKDDISRLILKFGLGLRLKNDIKYLFIFLAISSIFPILWVIGNYNAYGDFFYSETWTANWIKVGSVLNTDSPWHNPSFIKKLLIWPYMILDILNIVTIFGGVGLIWSLWKKKNLELASIFLVLISVFTYKLFDFTMTMQPRYIIMPILFFIPYIGIGVSYSMNDNGYKKINIATIIMMIIFVTASLYVAVMENSYVTPDYVLDVSKWIKSNVKPDENILLDEYNWWGLHILFFSGSNTTFTKDYLDTFEFSTDHIKIVPAGGKKIDNKVVMNYLENYKPKYLVYSPKGELRALNFSKECKNETALGYSFECKYTTDNYNIYKVHNN